MRCGVVWCGVLGISSLLEMRGSSGSRLGKSDRIIGAKEVFWGNGRAKAERGVAVWRFDPRVVCGERNRDEGFDRPSESWWLLTTHQPSYLVNLATALLFIFIFIFIFILIFIFHFHFHFFGGEPQRGIVYWANTCPHPLPKHSTLTYFQD